MATCLIIGANRGIGLSISRQLAARGETVMSVCLNEGEACEGAGTGEIGRRERMRTMALSALPPFVRHLERRHAQGMRAPTPVPPRPSVHYNRAIAATAPSPWHLDIRRSP